MYVDSFAINPQHPHRPPLQQTNQVLFGFAFLPFLQTQAFGGIPLRQIPQQFVLGYRCFQGVNSLPGDDCADAAKTMIG